MNDVTPLRDFLGADTEIKLFLMSLALGAVLGSFFDLLRALRLSVPHADTAVFIEDALFVTLGGLCFYSFCTELCGGVLRAFVLVGMAAGFFCYICSLGRLVKEILSTSLSTLFKMIFKIFKLLTMRA